MNHLKFLEFQRLMKELQFVEADYLYQSEIMALADNDFFKSVENILTEFPSLKYLYESKKDRLLKIATEPIIADFEQQDEVIVESLESKKLYREIVKTTHPDKIKNHKLNELYLEATDAYEKNDIITLYKVCSDLNIEFELPDNYIQQVREKIDGYKQRIKFMENTYTFKWLKTNSKSDKDKILLNFIRSGIM